jgi:predicted transcriptional regulator
MSKAVEPNARDARRRFIAQLAQETGTTVADVERHLSEAIAAGLLIETADGWQATIP